MDPAFPINDYISISKLEKFGNKSDLYRFRQLSGFYYDVVNPKYFDLLDPTVVLGDYDTRDKLADKPIKGGPGGREVIHIIAIAIKSSGPRPTASYKTLTSNNWTNDISQTIRTLKMDHIYFNPNHEVKCSGLSVPQIISQISPYITTLKLKKLPTMKDFYGQGDKFIEFMNQFMNLKSLFLTYQEHQEFESKKFKDIQLKSMEIDQLEIMIKSLKSKTNVEIKVLDNYIPFLNQFQSTSNIKFIFKNIRAAWNDSGMLKFEEVVKNMKLYPTQNVIELDISVRLETVDELKRLTDLCLQYKDKVVELWLGLNLKYEEKDAIDIRKYLTLLSPIVTHLEVKHGIRWNKRNAFDILSSGLDEEGWKNLEHLEIYGGYKHPLEILKKCPKLRHLHLEVGPECIFYDKTKTDEEIMMEYFGNLPSLTKLSYTAKQLKMKFGFDGGYSYLKSILPIGTSIEFWKSVYGPP